MNRIRVALVHKIASAGVVALLLCAPLQLTAQEREPRATNHQASAVEWFSSLWNDLTAWFTGTVPSPPPISNGVCSVDPWGGCYGS